MPKQPKTIIGRSEYIDFPDWGIRKILAKTDTGAKSSALHVEDIVRLPGGQVQFHVVVRRKPERELVEVTATPTRWAKVRSSSGHYQVRCFVKTRAIIGPIEKEIELSLVSREKLNFRMLIGRQALSKDFLVDVSKQHALLEKIKTRKAEFPT